MLSWVLRDVEKMQQRKDEKKRVEDEIEIERGMRPIFKRKLINSG